jgi:hypothetical protein
MNMPRGSRTLILGASTLASVLGQHAGGNQPEQPRTDTPAAQPTDTAPGSVLNPRLDEKRQVLAVLEGRWNLQSEKLGVPPASGSDAQATSPTPKMAGRTAERTWVLNSLFLQEVQAPPAGATTDEAECGMAYWGFDEPTGMYTLTLLEPSGRADVYRGRWNAMGQSIVLRGGHPSGLATDRTSSQTPGAANAAIVLRILSDSEHVIEVYGGTARREATRQEATPPPADTGKPEDEEPNGPEIESSQPGTAKLPSMLPPDEPAEPGATRPADSPIDPANLLYRMTYTRNDAAPENQPLTGYPNNPR